MIIFKTAEHLRYIAKSDLIGGIFLKNNCFSPVIPLLNMIITKIEIMWADGFSKSINHQLTTPELTVGLFLKGDQLLKINPPMEKMNMIVGVIS